MSDVQGFPNFSAPIATAQGQLTPSWRQFLQNLWNRTGGGSGGGGIGYVTGDLKPWPAPTIPGGWSVCDGAAISRTTYAGLFDLIGTTWGPGDGTSTFNKPDLRGRAPIGAGHGSGLSDRTLGDHGGAEATTLTVPNLPSHTHVLTDPGHTHTVTDPGHVHTALVASSTNTAGAAAGTSAAGNTGSAMTGISVNPAPTGLTIANTGSGDAATTMSPFAAVYWIIKL